MFRPVYENFQVVCWTIALFLLLSVLVYFLVGLIVKKNGIYLKILLIGEQCIFAVVSSVITFLFFSFAAALIVWVIVFYLMSSFFNKNLRLVSYIDYCEKNKNMLTSRQFRMLSQLNPRLMSTHITLWIKTFWRLRRESLHKMDDKADVISSKYRFKTLLFAFLTAGTIGVSVSYFTYGYLAENKDMFLMRLLENYTILSCVLFVLYVLLYLSLVRNIFHYMYEQKKLFVIIFGVFSAIMYVAVTVISMNTC